ncbi:MAG: hypothetical protein CL609_05800 [Anaerolineaceae bacterium]|nr:hypothetical protein [Anaerolineaceae bacterium]
MLNNKPRKVLLTGAFGLVGEETIRALLHQGHSLTCLDLDTPENRTHMQDLLQTGTFETLWVDICDAEAVKNAFNQCKPQAVLHLAAMVPPDCYVDPKHAYQVNVEGSKNLLDAARQCESLERFIFISSYSVHGPRNPNKEINAIRADTPINPGDNYARHKVIVETLVRESGLPWSIIRLPAVFGLRPQQVGQALMKYLFILPPERRQHAMDARDAGLALANSVHADILFRTLLLGGDAPDWMRTAGEFFGAIFQARGLKAIPDRYFRNPDPLVDEAWYYEDWVNTAESQLLLDYQKHSFNDYLNELKKQEKIGPGWLMNLMSPLVLKQLTKQSPYDRDQDSLDTLSHWQIVCKVFGIPIDSP